MAEKVKSKKKTAKPSEEEVPATVEAPPEEEQIPATSDEELAAFLAVLASEHDESKTRLDAIKESHVLLQQFTPKELKVLLNLKRNTSAKAWSLREDLIVLSLPLSNREIADLLKDRNKEAVKKRLQLLRSKGLMKRTYEGGGS